MARKSIPARRKGATIKRRVPVQLLDEAATGRTPVQAAPEATADGILVVDTKGRFASYNERFAQMWRIPKAVLQAADDQKALQFVLDQVRDPSGFVARVRQLYKQPAADSFDVIEFKDGRVFERYSQPQRVAGGIAGRVWSFRDVTEPRRHEAFLTGQMKVLELIAQGAPLFETLPALCEMIQGQSTELIPSILLLDADGVHVRHGAAPGLPESYRRAVDGQAIGEGHGSCGTAMFRRKTVIVEDIAVDPLWKDYRAVALQHGLRACWSAPIFDAHRRVLGSFACYFRSPVRPDRRHLRLIESATHIAAIALINQSEKVALRASEERFAKIFQTSPVAICLSTIAEGRILDVNPAFLALFGRERTELVGHLSVEAGLWATPVLRAEVVEELRRHGRVFNREGLFRKKNGESGTALFSAETLRVGGEACVLVLVNDITARKAAELELAVRHEALAAINSIARSVNGSLDLPSVIRSAVEALGNYAHSPAVSLFLLNEPAERLDLQCATGFFEESLRRGAHLPLRGSLSGLSVTSRQIIFSEEMSEDDRVEPRLRESLLAEGFHSALCLPLLNRDRVLGVMNLVFRQRRELSATERETFLAIGQTIGLALANAEQVARVQAEMEERRRTEAALRQSEERFAKAFRSAPVGICLSRLADGLVLDANNTFLNMYGVTREEVIGHTSIESGLWADASERSHLLERLKTEGHLKTFEGRIRRRSGEIGTVLSAVEKIELNGVPCLVTLQNDITERKRAERALAASREQLRALWARLQRTREAERTRIAREVHDVLGQLLTGLKLELAWCERRLPQISDPELRQVFAGKVVSTNQLADTMIETVQKIARELRPSVLDNFGLAAALEFETRQFQERTGVRCELALVAEPPVLEGERATEIFRIFQEILTNVARHAQATTAHIQLAQAGDQLTLQVCDNGRGVSEAEMADAKSLGLLGMRERAALMGGTIQFRGVPGAGTTVTLTVPLKKGK